MLIEILIGACYTHVVAIQPTARGEWEYVIWSDDVID